MWVDRREFLSFNDLRFNGAMAQLGARLHGMQKVASSSLAGSIHVSADSHDGYVRGPSCDGAALTILYPIPGITVGDPRHEHVTCRENPPPIDSTKPAAVASRDRSRFLRPRAQPSK